jgi:hypothetical protein
MQKSIPIGIALILAACGSAVTTTGNSAEAATQKQRRQAPTRPHVGFEDFSDRPGGMAGCFDPRLTGYPRRAAIAAGGRPCVTSRAPGASRATRGAAFASNWPAGRWTLRGEDCGGHTWLLDSNGVYYATNERGLWTLDGNVLFLNPSMENNRPSGGRQARAIIVARSADSFSMRAANGAVSHWVRCS